MNVPQRRDDKPEIIPTPRNADLHGQEEAYLYAEFGRCLQIDVENIIRRADILREFENQGKRFDRHKLGKFASCHKLLLGVAGGTIEPEVLTRFGVSGKLMRMIAALPAIEQRRVLREESVELAILKPDGGWETLRVLPERLSMDQLSQVFADGRIVDAEGQMQNLKLTALTTPKPCNLVTIGNVVVNKENGTIRTNGFATVAELQEAIRYLPTTAKHKS